MCLRVNRNEGVAWVILDRPDKLNALNAALLSALDAALQELETDPAIRVLLLRGSGDKAFAAGGDIAEFQTLDQGQALARARRGQTLMDRIERFPKPVIAVVNGWALGGGCELAMACHIRIAGASARFGLPEAGLGLIPGYGGTQRLPRLVGRGLALDMLLSGEPIPADRALQAGLVSRVFPDGDLDEGAERLARRLLERGPLALAAILSAVREGLDMSLVQALALEAEQFARVAATRDAREGTAAFVEKRKAEFSGA